MSNTLVSSMVLLGNDTTVLLNAALVGFFSLLAALESSFPSQQPSAKHTRQSYQANLGLFVFNSAVMSLLSLSSLLLLAQQYAYLGLLNTLDNPYLKAILSLLMLDALLYGWHKACHRFDGLWLVHKVHHNDPAVNVSTAFRVHVLELLLTTLLKALFIIAFGIDATMVLVYETLYPFFIVFHHANIAFKAERWLGWLIIVPALHRTHHAKQRSQHDHNYGAVLSIWDRLLGTLLVQEPFEIGLSGDTPQTFIKLLRFGVGSHDVSVVTEPVLAVEAMIAEAAYYKAEKRNFYPGDELADWFEAKHEIFTLICANSFKKQPTKKKWGGMFSRHVLAGF